MSKKPKYYYYFQIERIPPGDNTRRWGIFRSRMHQKCDGTGRKETGVRGRLIESSNPAQLKEEVYKRTVTWYDNEFWMVRRYNSLKELKDNIVLKFFL